MPPEPMPKPSVKANLAQQLRPEDHAPLPPSPPVVHITVAAGATLNLVLGPCRVGASEIAPGSL